MSTSDAIIPRSLMESLKDAFKIQASTPVKILDVGPAVPEKLASVGLIAAIGMQSTQYSGTLSLCFPDATFLGILEKMLGEKYPVITPENADAAGELLNIVYASARVKMNEGGNDFAPAIPTITHGVNMQMARGGNPKVVRLNCSCEFGSFFLEVSLRKSK